MIKTVPPKFSPQPSGRLFPAPREGAPVTVRQGVTSTEGSVADIFRTAVAAGAGDALGPSHGLLRGVQQTVQHLADRAVLAVERIRVHDR